MPVDVHLSRVVRTAAQTTALLLLSGCGPRNTPVAHPEEIWDAYNAPSIFGLGPVRYEQLIQPEALQGSLPHKPWVDSYWPYDEKNIAKRYAESHDFDSLDHQVHDAKSHAQDPDLSPAEKYDILTGADDFPLTSQSWSVYEDYKKRYHGTKSWDWMGICNGWAPAALNEAAPKHHVLAKSGGREVLFYEGDIRALLSKAYDLNATTDGLRMIGTRCDAKFQDIPRDKSGRPIDGRIDSTREPFTILVDDSWTTGVMMVTRDPQQPNPYWLVASQPLVDPTLPADLYIYNNQADVAADLQDKTIGQRASLPTPAHVTFYRNCRDANAASFHIALSDSLSNAAKTRLGFVAEMFRTEQIWNYPVWGFQSQIGRPYPVTQEKGNQLDLHAPGTAFLADVTTRLIYVGEVGPAAEYSDDDAGPVDWKDVDTRPSTYSHADLQYTLELDANGFVIGGEWAESPAYNVAMPDFFWRLSGKLTDQVRDENGKPGTPSILKYSLVKKLLDCSQGTPDRTIHVSLNGQDKEVSAVTCSI